MPGTWPEGELDELIEEVLVDAYGDSEQLGAFECVFADAGLPVAAVAVGMACSLDEVEFDGDERRGLGCRCAQGGCGDVAAGDGVSGRDRPVEL